MAFSVARSGSPLLAKLAQYSALAYERHGRRLPTLLSAILIFLIGWTLADLIWALVPMPEAARWRPAPAAPTAAAPASRGPDIVTITNARLFGAYQASAPVDVSRAPDTNLSLTLLGILAGSNEDDSRALISTQNGEEAPYSIGQDVTPGVSLHAIFPDRVILSRSGAFETLRLDKEKPSTAPELAAASPAPGDGSPAQMLGQIREQILLDPSKAGEFIRVQPANIGGALKGYRIYPGRDRGVFTTFGLRPGDLVTAVNGIQLDDGQKALQTLNELKQASSVSLTIERGGQPQTVTLSLH
jgi:general secretion pathway protein C